MADQEELTQEQKDAQESQDTIQASLTDDQLAKIGVVGGVAPIEKKDDKEEKIDKKDGKAPDNISEGDKGEEEKIEEGKDIVAEIFNIGKKNGQEDKKPEPLTTDERKELLTLKEEKVKAEETRAFEEVLNEYSPEETELLVTTAAEIISSPEYDKLDKFTAKQRAAIVVKFAEEKNKKAIQEIRTKAEAAKIDQAKKEVTSKKTIKEVADIHSDGSSEESPNDKRKRLEKAAAKGDRKALNSLLVDESEVSNLLKKLGR